MGQTTIQYIILMIVFIVKMMLISDGNRLYLSDTVAFNFISDKVILLEQQMNSSSSNNSLHDDFYEERNTSWANSKKEVLLRWCNEGLIKCGIQINNLSELFLQSTNFVKLIEAITNNNVPFSYEKDPKFKIHHYNNISKTMSYLEEIGVKMVNIDTPGLMNGHEKQILGLIWSMIVHFHVVNKDLINKKPDDGVMKTRNLKLKDWINRKIGSYIEINNFKEDWNDGRALACLINTIQPGTFPHWSRLDKNRKVLNCDNALVLAERVCKIPKIFDACDMALNKISEETMMAYLSQFQFIKTSTSTSESSTVGNYTFTYNDKINFTIENKNSTFYVGKSMKLILVTTVALCAKDLKVVIVSKTTNIRNIFRMVKINDQNFELVYVPKNDGFHLAKLLINNKIIENFSITFKVEKSFFSDYELNGKGISNKCMMFFPTKFELSTLNNNNSLSIDNIMIQIKDPQNIFKLKPICMENKNNVNIFTFQYTPKTYFEHHIQTIIDNKEIELEINSFTPLITSTMCTLIVNGNEILETESLALFSIDYTEILENSDYYNLSPQNISTLFKIYGAYTTEKSDIIPIDDIYIDYECEGRLNGRFTCKQAGIYYINATLNDYPILNSPGKIITTNFNCLEILESPQNVPFVKELYKIEIKTKNINSIRPEYLKVAFEGFDFILAQVELEGSKLIAKLIFEHEGNYKMKIFYNDELCFVKKNITIFPELSVNGISLTNPIITSSINDAAATNCIASIRKRPGLSIENVEIRALNDDHFDYEKVTVSTIQTDIHFTLEYSGTYIFDVYYYSDGCHKSESYPFYAINSKTSPYIQIINLEQLISNGIVTNKKYNIELFAHNYKLDNQLPKIICEVIRFNHGTTLINADHMGSNWFRITLMENIVGLHELSIIVDNKVLPNFPVKIKCVSTNDYDSKSSFYFVENEKDLFVGKPINIYTNVEIIITSTVIFKGPAPVDFLLSRQSTPTSHIICVCTLPGVYQLLVQDHEKNINSCKKIFSVRPTPPHYFSGIVLPFEGLVNSFCEIPYTPEIVTVSSGSNSAFFVPIIVEGCSTIIGEMKSVTSPNNVHPVKIIWKNNNKFQIIAEPQRVGLHMIEIQFLSDKNNVLELKSIGFIVKCATLSNIGDVYPFAIQYIDKAQIYGFDSDGKSIDIIRINDAEYSCYGEVQSHSLIPKSAGTVRIDYLIPKISCSDIDILKRFGCVVNTVFTLIVQVENIQELALLEREIFSKFFATFVQLSNGKSKTIYAHYYGNGIFLVPIKCLYEGTYQLALCLGDDKLLTTKFKVNHKNHSNIRIYSEKDLCELKPVQVIIDCRCAPMGTISVSVNGPVDTIFHSQEIIERICCLTFYPPVKGNYTINCCIDCKLCANSPFVLNIKECDEIYKWPATYGINPMVDVPYYFEFLLALPSCQSDGFIKQKINVFDKSFIQATIINTDDSTSQWLRIHSNTLQNYKFKNSGLSVAEAVIRTSFGIVKLVPQAFYVTQVPRFEYEYPNHIYIYDELKSMDGSSITIKGYDGQNIVKKVSEDINSDDPGYARIIKVLFVPNVFGIHKIKIDEKNQNSNRKHLYRLIVEFPKSICIYDRPYLVDISENGGGLCEYFIWVDASSYEIGDYAPKFKNTITKKHIVKGKIVCENSNKKFRFGSINYGIGWYFVTLQAPSLSNYTLQMFYCSEQFDTIKFKSKEKAKDLVVIYPKTQIFEVCTVGEFLIDARKLMFNDLNVLVEHQFHCPVPFYAKPLVKGLCLLYVWLSYGGNYSIIMKSNNKPVNGSPYEFKVDDTKSNTKSNVIAYGEHPFENSSWTKSFVPKAIFGGAGFNLVELKHVPDDTLECVLICINNNYKEILSLKHISNNIYEVSMVPKYAGPHIIDMRLINTVQDMGLYSIPFTVQSSQIIKKGHLAKIPLSIPLFKNIDKLSLDNNMKENDSALALDDIEVVIGSDGNYVEIPFVSNSPGVHTVFLNKNSFYKFHVVDTTTEEYFKINFDLIDKKYLLSNGLLVDKPYKLWIQISKFNSNLFLEDFKISFNPLMTDMNNNNVKKSYIIQPEQFSDEILEFSLLSVNNSSYSIGLLYRGSILPPTHTITSDGNSYIRLLHYESDKIVVNEPLQILFDLRHSKASTISLLLDSPVYTESINTLISDDFIVFTCLPKAQGIYSLRYKENDFDSQEKVYQFFVPNIDTYIHLGHKILPRHINIMTSNSINYLTTELQFLCCDEDSPTRSIKFTKDLEFEGILLHAESLKIMKLMSVELIDQTKINVSFKSDIPGLHLLNIRVFMPDEEKSYVAYPIPVVIHKQPEFVSGFPAVTPVLLSMRSVNANVSVTSQFGEDIFSRSIIDKSPLFTNIDGSYLAHLILYDLQPGIYIYSIDNHIEETIKIVDRSDITTISHIKLMDMDGLFSGPGLSKFGYRFLCSMDETVLRQSNECGLICLISSLFNDFRTVTFGILTDDKNYQLSILCPYEGCYSVQFVYGHFYTQTYQFYISDNAINGEKVNMKTCEKFLPLMCCNVLSSAHDNSSLMLNVKNNSDEQPDQILLHDKWSDPQYFRKLALCSTPRAHLCIKNEKTSSDETPNKNIIVISTSEPSGLNRNSYSKSKKSSILKFIKEKSSAFKLTNLHTGKKHRPITPTAFKVDISLSKESLPSRSRSDTNIRHTVKNYFFKYPSSVQQKIIN